MLDRPNALKRPKAPSAADIAVGANVRLRRTMLGISQEKLAEQIGVTFQQVQKYEKGANRIGASRLLQISAALNMPVSMFFEGVADVARSNECVPPLPTFTAADYRLVAAFNTITDDVQRRRVIQLVESMAKTGAPLAA